MDIADSGNIMPPRLPAYRRSAREGCGESEGVAWEEVKVDVKHLR